MAKPSSVPLTLLQIRGVADHADCSESTVRRYLSGVVLLPSTMRRVARALVAEGYGSFVRVEEQSGQRAA